MKVKELIAQLQELPQDFEVVLASDEEGNSFHPLAAYGMGWYYAGNYEFSSWIEEEEDEHGEWTMVQPPIQRTVETSNAITLWP